MGQGGWPVWYIRDEIRGDLAPNVEDRILTWLVRLSAEPGDRSDWLHEREWRVPCPPDNPQTSIHLNDLVAILVGAEDWMPMTWGAEVNPNGETRAASP